MDIKQMINDVKKLYTIQQVPSEWLSFLQHINNIETKTILEIGFGNGGGALCLSHFTDCLISIDVKKLRNKEIIKKIRNNCEFHMIINDSNTKKSARSVESFLKNRKIDLLIIDGSHSYRGAKNDFNRYMKFMNPNGTIALHDITFSEYHVKQKCKVYKFWNEIKDKYNSFEISNSDWGGFGIITL